MRSMFYLNALHNSRHENAAGFYRVSVYFTCKLLFDLIPMRVIPIMGYSTIVYFMLGKYEILKIFY